ncbi:MAG: response regulator, partial [Chlorobiales bacterium]|nr:response regulator [Chlorobiales bacterium]
LQIIAQQKPDLIITDWEMPEMDGMELIKHLKESEETKDIPIIVATGIMLESENLKTALETGAVDYVKKPIDATELIARTQSAIKLAEYQKQIIEDKYRQLSENTLYLLQANEFNAQLVKKLQHLYKKTDTSDQETRDLYDEIIDELQSRLRDDSWKRFEIYFQRLYNDFVKDLMEKFPSLTTNDIKLCAFLKQGMSSKDIAAITYQTDESVRVARYRLRKKLGLDQSQNLASFLAKF